MPSRAGFSPEGTFAVRLPLGHQAKCNAIRSWGFGPSELTSVSGLEPEVDVAPMSTIPSLFTANPPSLPHSGVLTLWA